MDLFFEIVGALVAIAGMSVLGYVYFGGRRRADEEQELQPVYAEQCGGGFDGWCFTVPFVRLAVYERFIVVAYGRTRHVLQRGDIQEVSMRGHLLFRGIHIKHGRADVPQSFILWSLHPDKAMEALGGRNV